MKKLLSILIVAAMLVACGGEKKSSNSDETNQKSEVEAKTPNDFADKMMKYMNRMLDAVEADDYDAFKNAHYSLYLLMEETPEEVKSEGMPILKAKQEKVKERYNKHAYRFESWAQRSAAELEEEGLLYYGK
jgi:PBP1b-binding outer membrane lipoprotein LpoB